jgi:hypothetical protein
MRGNLGPFALLDPVVPHSWVCFLVGEIAIYSILLLNLDLPANGLLSMK